jgi:hypothetical protein
MSCGAVSGLRTIRLSGRITRLIRVGRVRTSRNPRSFFEGPLVTIQVTCESCYRTYGVKDQYAGRRIKCPDCGSPVQIPDGAARPPAEENIFGDDEFGFAAEPPPPRSRQGRSSSAKSPSPVKSGTSIPVVWVIIAAAIGGLALMVCGGIVVFFMVAGDGGGPVAAAGRTTELDRVIAVRQIGATREESGSLRFTDDTVDETGEYYDDYTLTLNQGDVYVVDLYSDDFDPYLIVREDTATSDFQLENDDFGSGDTTRAHVIFQAPRAGTYRIIATTFEEGESGRYQLTMRNVTPGPGSSGPTREESGSLEAGDEQLEAGEYVDVHTLSAEEGDLYLIDLHSNEFDTYLFVTGPDGSDLEIHNDDLGQLTSRSQITLMAPRRGEYEIHATTFEAGESGSYRLTIQKL